MVQKRATVEAYDTVAAHQDTQSWPTSEPLLKAQISLQKAIETHKLKSYRQPEDSQEMWLSIPGTVLPFESARTRLPGSAPPCAPTAVRTT